MARMDDQDWINRFEDQGEDLVRRNLNHGHYGQGTRQEVLAVGWLEDKKAARREARDLSRADREALLVGAALESSPSRIESWKLFLTAVLALVAVVTLLGMFLGWF